MSPPQAVQGLTGSGSTSTRPVNALYLKIKTDAGLEGTARSTEESQPSSTRSSVLLIVKIRWRRSLVGPDAPLQPGIRGAAYLMAISAVDNTLWDLRGRYYNLTTVYRLLGGPDATGRGAMPVAWDIPGAGNRPFAFEAVQSDSSYEMVRTGRAIAMPGLRKRGAGQESARGALGDEIEIMFDAFSQVGSKLFAIEWAKQVERYQPIGSKRPSIPKRSKVSRSFVRAPRSR